MLRLSKQLIVAILLYLPLSIQASLNIGSQAPSFILNDQNNLDDFLQGVTIDSGYKMSAQQSKSLLKQAGVENIDFNLPEQIGAQFDPTFRTLARELGEASDEGTQKFNDRLIKI